MNKTIVILEQFFNGFLTDQDFSSKAEDETNLLRLVEDTKADGYDPVRLLLIARKLSHLGETLEDVVKADAYTELATEYVDDVKTINKFGVKITQKLSPVYEYLDDPIITKYTASLTEFSDKVKSLKTSIKNREKQLVDEGLVIELDPVKSYSVG